MCKRRVGGFDATLTVFVNIVILCNRNKSYTGLLRSISSHKMSNNFPF